MTGVTQSQTGGAHLEDDVNRARAIQFLTARVRQLPPEVLTDDVETCILEDTQRLLRGPVATTATAANADASASATVSAASAAAGAGASGAAGASSASATVAGASATGSAVTTPTAGAVQSATATLSGEEFVTLVSLLMPLRKMQSVLGRTQLIKLIADQALLSTALPDANVRYNCFTSLVNTF